MTKYRHSGDRQHIRQKYFRRGDGALMVRDPDGRFRRVDTRRTEKSADPNPPAISRRGGAGPGEP